MHAACIHFVTLIVSDLARARRFYLDGLGWPAALTAPGEVAMIHVGDKLVLSLWAEAAAREEVGDVARGVTLPFTLAHNVDTHLRQHPAKHLFSVHYCPSEANRHNLPLHPRRAVGDDRWMYLTSSDRN